LHPTLMGEHSNSGIMLVTIVPQISASDFDIVSFKRNYMVKMPIKPALHEISVVD